MPLKSSAAFRFVEMNEKRWLEQRNHLPKLLIG